MNRFLFLFLCLFATIYSYAQNGRLAGQVVDATNNEPIPFANILIQGTSLGVATDFDGNYVLENLEPGLANIQVTFVGYEPKTIFEIEISNAKTTFIDVQLNQSAATLKTVEITTSQFNKTEESPVSMRTINATEIQRNPGGNRDISKVLQSLPGVASSVAFRNDIIIRGGAPNENRFYLDGIEVPNINHFATQGSSGGPVGMLNVNFISEVDFYSGAFPSNRGNALSAVLEFKQKEGNKEKLQGNFTVGSSDFGLTFDGPIGEKTTFIFSARRSYLQFLFQALKLPFLPTYNDAQFKTTINLNKKNRLTIIGLGAFDDFELNESVNDGVTDTELISRNDYILGNIPVSDQWNYTIGANYRHFRDKSFQTIVVSRNHLNNKAVKYANNDNSTDDNLLFNYVSQEIENKFRFENTYRNNGYKLNAGIAFENVTYTNETFNKISIGDIVQTIEFDSRLNFNKYGAFVQLSKSLLSSRLILSGGLRTDFSDYSTQMLNPLKQLSPRLSASYSITEKLSFNANTGIYYQLPPYTALGYRVDDVLVNRDELTFIECQHVVAGFEYMLGSNAKTTIEGFYKNYSNYPFLLSDSISLANLGSEFGIIGNDPVSSSSSGRSYGVEFLYQQKLYKGFYGVVAYTLVRSEFDDKNGDPLPSAWDNGHIVSLTGGKKFKSNWEIGLKWRFSGGAPYTPYDLQTSSLIPIWDVNGQGVLDYDRLNSERLANTHGLDIRVDKRFYFQKWTLNIYVDIQNLYNYQTELAPYIDVERDANKNPIVNPDNPLEYKTYFVNNSAGTLLPSIGLMIEF
ncbi:TonB-dependent receptor [Flavobacteriales bacterium]|nr:TonB-dependent receptor [Flavobacteriales bacterium]